MRCVRMRGESAVREENVHAGEEVWQCAVWCVCENETGSKERK